MLEIICTQGLPGCGKSTWALEQIAKHPDRYKRVNRDSLRSMIDGGKHSATREEFIRQAELMLAKMYLDAGYHMIIDDTNLSPTTQAMWMTFAKEQKAQLVWKDFTDVPPEVCIERDLKRLNSVGERVIRDMYNKYLRPKKITSLVAYDPNLPDAFICDLDGTLALFDGRGPYETEKCESDLLNEAVAMVVRQSIAAGLIPIFTSGRSNEFFFQTANWLIRHGFEMGLLFMRQSGDRRKDAEVKRELYKNHIEGCYNVRYVLDDRRQVVDVWRELGLVCFQVADGEY